MRNPDDLLTKLIMSFYDIKLGEDEMERTIIMSEHIKTNLQPEKQDSITIVLVIGESYIREHASIYGYPLNTTPFLLKEKEKGRLFVFDNMISPFNQTTGVIRNLISCNSIGDGEHWSSKPPFTAIYKKSGYYVSMMDNQKDFGLDALFSYSLNTYLYNPRVVKACYSEVNDSTFEYDGQLIDYYKRLSLNKQRRQLIIFHLLGQHTEFEYRYPKDFSYFSLDSISSRKKSWLTEEMRKYIAHYDNATRYNDYVLNKIINLVINDNSVVIYLSDHGEEVYDYRDNYGRDAWSMGGDPKQVIRWQYMVPFVVWCSDKYKAKNPSIITQLEKATARPGMLDNVCQVLFHLSGLNTPYYNTSRDILSPKYHCPRRLINGHINSDSIINSK
jgi:heptose-I-phosphate ethanolaminephosphotransferase